MSSILKALKKLEHDTAKYKPELFRIDEKILHEESSARFSATAISLIAVALFVCGSGAMYLYMKHKAPSVPMTQPQSSHSASNVQPAVPKNITPVLKNNTQKTITPAVPSTKTRPAVPQTQTKIRTSDAARPPQLVKRDEKAQTSTLVATVPATTSVSRPTLTVNGIAFQDGSRNNMALINGITTSSGDVIEGVKIEEIQKNRVIFSQGGEQFEIKLNKSNR